MITSQQKSAAIITLGISTLIVLLLCVMTLSWHGAETWPPQPSPYIVLQADEYVELEQPTPPPPTRISDASAPAQTPEVADVPSQVAPPTGTSLNNGATEGRPAQIVTTTRPSPVKTPAKPQPQKTGTPKPDPQQPQQTTQAQRTENFTENIFAQSQGKHNANNHTGDTGQAGRPDGNPASAGNTQSHGTNPGVRKGRLGGGWTWPPLPRNIQSNGKTGSVIIEFTINPNGTVNPQTVTAIGGAIPASGDATLKARCIAYVKALRFPRTGNQPATEPTEGNRLTFEF